MSPLDYVKNKIAEVLRDEPEPKHITQQRGQNQKSPQPSHQGQSPQQVHRLPVATVSAQPQPESSTQLSQQQMWEAHQREVVQWEQREAQQRDIQNREAQHKDIQHREAQQRDFQHREAQQRDIQHREAQQRDIQHREAQQRDIQHREAQQRDIQHREAQQRDIQHREAQQRDIQHREAQQRDIQQREAQQREAQQRDFQHREAQQRDFQQREAQQRDIQHREAQQRDIHHREAQQRDIQHREMQQREMQMREASSNREGHDQREIPQQREAFPSSTSQMSDPTPHMAPDKEALHSSKQVTGSNDVSDSSGAVSSQQQKTLPAAMSKKKMFGRSRARFGEEPGGKFSIGGGPRDHVKVSPSSASSSEVHRASTTSEKKGTRSEYDFPDSPEDDPMVKGSYMALSSTIRSPRRGVVDSTDNRQGTEISDSTQDDGQVHSSDSRVGSEQGEVQSSDASYTR